MISKEALIGANGTRVMKNYERKDISNLLSILKTGKTLSIGGVEMYGEDIFFDD